MMAASTPRAGFFNWMFGVDVEIMTFTLLRPGRLMAGKVCAGAKTAPSATLGGGMSKAMSASVLIAVSSAIFVMTK